MTISQEAIDSLQELKRMHLLNIELLEQLAVACDYLVKNNVQVPNASTFSSLVTKAMTLLDEITANEPKILQYNRVTDGNLQRNRTDKDFTEP